MRGARLAEIGRIVRLVAFQVTCVGASGLRHMWIEFVDFHLPQETREYGTPDRRGVGTVLCWEFAEGTQLADPSLAL